MGMGYLKISSIATYCSVQDKNQLALLCLDQTASALNPTLKIWKYRFSCMLSKFSLIT